MGKVQALFETPEFQSATVDGRVESLRKLAEGRGLTPVQAKGYIAAGLAAFDNYMAERDPGPPANAASTMRAPRGTDGSEAIREVAKMSAGGGLGSSRVLPVLSALQAITGGAPRPVAGGVGSLASGTTTGLGLTGVGLAGAPASMLTTPESIAEGVGGQIDKVVPESMPEGYGEMIAAANPALIGPYLIGKLAEKTGVTDKVVGATEPVVRSVADVFKKVQAAVDANRLKPEATTIGEAAEAVGSGDIGAAGEYAADAMLKAIGTSLPTAAAALIPGGASGVLPAIASTGASSALALGDLLSGTIDEKSKRISPEEFLAEGFPSPEAIHRTKEMRKLTADDFGESGALSIPYAAAERAGIEALLGRGVRGIKPGGVVRWLANRGAQTGVGATTEAGTEAFQEGTLMARENRAKGMPWEKALDPRNMDAGRMLEAGAQGFFGGGGAAAASGASFSPTLAETEAREEAIRKAKERIGTSSLPIDEMELGPAPVTDEDAVRGIRFQTAPAALYSTDPQFAGPLATLRERYAAGEDPEVIRQEAEDLLNSEDLSEQFAGAKEAFEAQVGGYETLPTSGAAQESLDAVADKIEQDTGQRPQVRAVVPKTPWQRRVHRVLSNLGVEAVFFDAGPGRAPISGLSLRPGVVLVDVKLAKGEAYEHIALHELTHELKRRNPTAYRALVAAMRDESKADLWAAAEQAAIEAGTEQGAVEEETLAYLAQQNGGEVWRALMRVDEKYLGKPGAVQSALEWVHDMMIRVGRSMGIKNVGTFKDARARAKQFAAFADAFESLRARDAEGNMLGARSEIGPMQPAPRPPAMPRRPPVPGPETPAAYQPISQEEIDEGARVQPPPPVPTAGTPLAQLETDEQWSEGSPPMSTVEHEATWQRAPTSAAEILAQQESEARQRETVPRRKKSRAAKAEEQGQLNLPMFSRRVDSRSNVVDAAGSAAPRPASRPATEPQTGEGAPGGVLVEGEYGREGKVPEGRGEDDRAEAPRPAARRKLTAREVVALRDLKLGDYKLAREAVAELPQGELRRMLIESGVAFFKGYKLTSYDGLASIAQVLRDQRFETLRYVFVDENNVILETASISSRLPTMVNATPKGYEASPEGFEQWLDQTRKRMTEIGAAKWFMIHNHPSGDPTPSAADFNLTRDVSIRVPGFSGHLVINGTKYSVIAPTGKLINYEDMPGDFYESSGNSVMKDVPEDAVTEPYARRADIGRKVKSASKRISVVEDVVKLAKGLKQKDGKFAVAFTDAKNTLVWMTEHDVSEIEDVETFRSTIREVKSGTGAMRAFLIAASPEGISRIDVDEMIRRNDLTDAYIPNSGKMTNRQRGAYQSGIYEYGLDRQGIQDRTTEVRHSTRLPGDVEARVYDLFEKHRSPTGEQLRALIPVADESTDTPSFQTLLRRIIKIIRDPEAKETARTWYKEFADGAREIVGPENMHEFAALFALFSPQTKVRMNLAETFWTMKLARDYYAEHGKIDGDAEVTGERIDARGKKHPTYATSGFIKYMLDHRVPVVEKGATKTYGWFKSPTVMREIVKLYNTGDYLSSGAKTQNYAGAVGAAGINKFWPYTVNDRHVSFNFGLDETKLMERSDKSVNSYRAVQAIIGKLAERVGLQPDQAQAALWYYSKKYIDTGAKEDDIGGWDEAAEFSQRASGALKQALVEGSALKAPRGRVGFVGQQTKKMEKEGESPYEMTTTSAEEVEESSIDTSPYAIASTKPGGYGKTSKTGKKTSIASLKKLHQKFRDALLDDDGKLKFLNELNIPHTVLDAYGGYTGVEPGFHVVLPYANRRVADAIGALLGRAFDQDAVVTIEASGIDEIVSDTTRAMNHGLHLTKPDGEDFTPEEIHEISGRLAEVNGDGGVTYLPRQKAIFVLNLPYMDLSDQQFYDNVVGAIPGTDVQEFYVASTYLTQRGDRNADGTRDPKSENRGYEEAVRRAWPYIRRRSDEATRRILDDYLYSPAAEVLEGEGYRYKHTGKEGLAPTATVPAWKTKLSDVEEKGELKERFFATRVRATDPSGVTYSMPTPDAWMSPLGQLIDDYLTKGQDRLLRLKRAQEQVGDLEDYENAYLLEEQMYGKVQDEVERAHDRFVTPIKVLLKGADIDDVHKFLVARHAMERNRRVHKRHWSKAEPGEWLDGSGMSDNDAIGELRRLVRAGKLEADLDEFARAHGYQDANHVGQVTPEEQTDIFNSWNAGKGGRVAGAGFRPGKVRMGGKLGRIADHFDKMTSYKLDVLERDGLESKDVLDIYRNYNYYAPLKGRETEFEWEWSENKRPTTGKGLDVRGKSSKVAQGRKTIAAHNALVQGIADMDAAIVTAHKNQVGQAFLKMVEANPNPDLWEVNRAFKQWAYNPKTGESMLIPDRFAQSDPNVFGVRVNGRDVYITIYDTRLASAMKNLGATNMAGWMKLHAKAMRFLAMMSTSLNPEFMIPNLVRDLQTAGINMTDNELRPVLKKVKFRNVANAIGGILAAEFNGKTTGWSATWDEYKRSGARIGFFGLRTIEDRIKALENDLTRGTAMSYVHRGLEMVNDANLAFENGTRLAVFKAAKDAGLSDLKAASVARNITVNFNRRGTADSLSALYMFANAGIQGTARLARAMKSPAVQALMMGQVALGYGLAAYNRAVMGDDDDEKSKWDKIPSYVKERNWMVALPNESGNTAMVPAPYGYNVGMVLGYAIESMVNGKGNAATAAADVASAVVGAFNPLNSSVGRSWTSTMRNVVPTIGRIPYDLVTNKNFADLPIYPTNYTNFSRAYLERSRGASEPAKAIARWISQATGGLPPTEKDGKLRSQQGGWFDMYPDALDYIISGVTGGLGRMTRDLASSTVKGVIKKEDLKSREIPITRRFWYEWDAATSAGGYYDAKEEIYDLKRTLESLKGTTAIEFRRQHQRALGLVDSLKATERDLRKLTTPEEKAVRRKRWLRQYYRTMEAKDE